MVTCTSHIGIHEGVDGRTYVRTDVHDVMAMKPNFLTSMGYHIFAENIFGYHIFGVTGTPHGDRAQKPLDMRTRIALVLPPFHFQNGGRQIKIQHVIVDAVAPLSFL